jgi:hypothetical protein
MKVTGSFVTSVKAHETTWRHIPDDPMLHCYSYENLKSGMNTTIDSVKSFFVSFARKTGLTISSLKLNSTTMK